MIPCQRHRPDKYIGLFFSGKFYQSKKDQREDRLIGNMDVYSLSDRPSQKYIDREPRRTACFEFL